MLDEATGQLELRSRVCTVHILGASVLDEEPAVAMLRALLHAQVIMCSKETPQI